MKSILNCTLEEFMNIIYKPLAIAAIITLLLTVFCLKRELNAAHNYINRLESDFPEYIDTTSGTDEFSNYYNWK